MEVFTKFLQQSMAGHVASKWHMHVVREPELVGFWGNVVMVRIRAFSSQKSYKSGIMPKSMIRNFFALQSIMDAKKVPWVPPARHQSLFDIIYFSWNWSFRANNSSSVFKFCQCAVLAGFSNLYSLAFQSTRNILRKWTESNLLGVRSPKLRCTISKACTTR